MDRLAPDRIPRPGQVTGETIDAVPHTRNQHSAESPSATGRIACWETIETSRRATADSMGAVRFRMLAFAFGHRLSEQKLDLTIHTP